MTYIKKYSSMQISQSNYTIIKIIMIPISDFQEVIFLDLETLPKLVFTILVPLQILQTNCEFLTNFGFFFAQNLKKLKL